VGAKARAGDFNRMPGIWHKQVNLRRLRRLRLQVHLKLHQLQNGPRGKKANEKKLNQTQKEGLKVEQGYDNVRILKLEFSNTEYKLKYFKTVKGY